MIAVKHNNVCIDVMTEAETPDHYKSQCVVVGGLWFYTGSLTWIDLLKFVGGDLWDSYANGKIDFAVPVEFSKQYPDIKYVWSYIDSSLGAPVYINDLPVRAAKIALELIVKGECNHEFKPLSKFNCAFITA